MGGAPEAYGSHVCGVCVCVCVCVCVFISQWALKSKHCRKLLSKHVVKLISM